LLELLGKRLALEYDILEFAREKGEKEKKKTHIVYFCEVGIPFPT